MRKPKVVVIGGGTGLSVLLRGLKLEPVDITAIVTVADDGGSSGRLRDELHMPPPGDIRNVLVALADTEPLLESLLQHRFHNGNGLAGHSIGNLLIAALTEISGDFVTAVEQLSKVLAVRGRVLPAANQAVVLNAKMEDGTVVSGESLIPKSGKKIKRVFIDQENVEGLDDAIQALTEADLIAIGPGSLYTSILPNLLVPGIVEAIRNSSAVKVFICNVMTQPGETDGFSVADHIQAIHDHVGNSLFNYVIINNGEVTPQLREKYAVEGSTPVYYYQEEMIRYPYKIIADDFLICYDDYLRHNAIRISRTLRRLIGVGT
ncbi:MAG TPA: hypothetical protein DDY49_02940 [Paenibacillaceae bacterium]|nr:hypothetical protein [Paenibacillaceae bacterium]